MQEPVQIQFDGLPSSDAVHNRILERIDHLERLFPRIVSGRVVVQRINERHKKGEVFRVRVELNVPRERLVISHDPGDKAAHTDVYVAIRDSFDAMERVLQDYARKMNGQIKHHEEPLAEGKVARIFPYDGYGFIATGDEREVYFDANAVVDGEFDKMEVGHVVKFFEQMGQKGPQASTVHV
jgi:cold shock CspA family protein/ribosome-associated translation inhibitor RaiA